MSLSSIARMVRPARAAIAVRSNVGARSFSSAPAAAAASSSPAVPTPAPAPAAAPATTFISTLASADAVTSPVGLTGGAPEEFVRRTCRIYKPSRSATQQGPEYRWYDSTATGTNGVEGAMATHRERAEIAATSGASKRQAAISTRTLAPSSLPNRCCSASGRRWHCTTNRRHTRIETEHIVTLQ